MGLVTRRAVGGGAGLDFGVGLFTVTTVKKVCVFITAVPIGNPKLQGGWCKPNHQPIGGSDPNHQGMEGRGKRCVGLSVCVCVYYCRT